MIGLDATKVCVRAVVPMPPLSIPSHSRLCCLRQLLSCLNGLEIYAVKSVRPILVYICCFVGGSERLYCPSAGAQSCTERNPCLDSLATYAVPRRTQRAGIAAIIIGLLFSPENIQLHKPSTARYLPAFHFQDEALQLLSISEPGVLAGRWSFSRSCVAVPSLSVSSLRRKQTSHRHPAQLPTPKR